MGLTDCIDSSYTNLTNLLGASNSLFDPNLFFNPQAPIITGVLEAVNGQRDHLWNAIATAGQDTPEGQRLLDMYNAIYGVTHGGTGPINPTSLMSRMGMYTEWTNFLSGQVNIFPSSLMPVVSQLPQGAAMAVTIGTLTFAGLLGMTMGAQAATAELCQKDPNNPCAAVAAIFAAIFGALNKVLNAITEGFNMITEWVSVVVAEIEQWIAEILDFITKSLSALMDALLEALRKGFAGLLTGMSLDPCMAQILQAVGTAALLAAIPESEPLIPLL